MPVLEDSGMNTEIIYVTEGHFLGYCLVTNFPCFFSKEKFLLGCLDDRYFLNFCALSREGKNTRMSLMYLLRIQTLNSEGNLSAIYSQNCT